MTALANNDQKTISEPADSMISLTNDDQKTISQATVILEKIRTLVGANNDRKIIP